MDALPRVLAALASVEAEAIHTSEDIQQVCSSASLPMNDDGARRVIIPLCFGKQCDVLRWQCPKQAVRTVWQVSAVQRERAALWRCLHGGLGPAGSVRPGAIDSELLVFVWMRLRRTLARLPNCSAEDSLTAAGVFKHLVHVKG